MGESEDPWLAVHVSPSVFIPTQAVSSPVVTELLVNLQVCPFWFWRWLSQSLPWEIVALDGWPGLA